MQRVFYLLICLLFSVSLYAKKETHIILRLSKSAQSDTLGYNIVSQLSQILYFDIQSNRVKIWDSNKKQTEIQPTTITDLERTSGIKFVDLDNIFLYETWLQEKSTVTVTTLGILFATKDKRGEDVTFGYIDFADIKDLLLTRYLSVNANGYINLDAGRVINTKRYNYDIVQYGRKLVSNITLSEKYKNDVFQKCKLNLDIEPIAKRKTVRYAIEKGMQKKEPKTEKANALLDTLSAYLTRNMDVFYNLGGDKLQSHISKRSVNITKVEIEEQWLQKDGQTTYKPNWITLYIDDKPMSPMAVEDMMDWKLVIYFSNLDRFLRDKLFAYSILKINNQSIPTGKGEAYANALRTGNWSQLNQIVK